ncbi:(2Fe-2S)-binding protein [Bradyrhizobium sp. C-145]|uniref:(2Fe-2S)-binding protein n=1 Tax=Bradyrhizobium sp. C-145 TaxID=574727 RepID=UPI00201B74BD|nr:(2Fe-2S)-binding protein [Bradyrhizobium sp. C-145]UQR61687.1 (2Fe-2S)-binding protein [Bradyrhizobium sp. C-145]
MNRKILNIVVNGESHQLLIEPHWTLLQILRNEIGMMGTKENCLEAECGVCTVLLDGRAVNSCILLAGQAEGCSITTIEGIGDPEHLHPLQEAFIECGAVQCGYCIPGMILTAKSFLDEHPGCRPSREEIREAIAGTLCRCTGYRKIIDAVETAADRIALSGAKQ